MLATRRCDRCPATGADCVVVAPAAIAVALAGGGPNTHAVPTTVPIAIPVPIPVATTVPTTDSNASPATASAAPTATAATSTAPTSAVRERRGCR